MPMMKMLQTKRVPTKLGHMLAFIANEPREVPWGAVPDCQAAGAVVIDEDGLGNDESAGHQVYNVASELRRSIILRVMQEIIDRNDVVEFDAGAAPKLEVIKQRSQLTTDAGERDELHILLKKAAIEKHEIIFHPGTDAAMEALNAGTREEIMAVAKKRGVSKPDMKALERLPVQDAKVRLIGYMGDYTGD